MTYAEKFCSTCLHSATDVTQPPCLPCIRCAVLGVNWEPKVQEKPQDHEAHLRAIIAAQWKYINQLLNTIDQMSTLHEFPA